MIPYGRQTIDEDDIAAVVEVLRSDWLTTGPKVGEFEEAFAAFVDAKEAVAVSNGTAALHAAMYALGIGPGDEVIVPVMTFAASANCVVYQGGTPVFVDVDPQTLLIDPALVEQKITAKTKAIIAVDYAGQPCDYDALRTITDRYDLALVDDACHAIGGFYKERPVGSLADLNTFSFHPVKHITTGEGGMITTDDARLAQKIRAFRNHGITSDHRQRSEEGSWFYEMIDLGYNYRITDFQCVLGMSQLSKLPGWIKKRQSIANHYTQVFNQLNFVQPLIVNSAASHAYHLYVVRFDLEQLGMKKNAIFSTLRSEGIGANVHYIPVHLHPYYQRELGTKLGDYPVAEQAYEEIVTLPIYPHMTDKDVENVISVVERICSQDV